MALLGLFSRKDKKSSTSKAGSSDSSNLPPKPSPSPSDSTSVTETDYVSVRRDALPHATNGPYNGPPAAAASTSKLRQAFARKKSPTLLDGVPRLPLASSPSTSPPPVPYSPSILSDSVNDDHSFRPPPSKSSIFSAYADPKGALSTRSLPANRPNYYHSRNHSSSREAASVDVHALEPPPPLPQPVPKSGGLFAWAHRGRKKSKPSNPPPQPPPHSLQSLSVDLSSDSFNLKSFRHVGGASDPSAAPISLLPHPPSFLANSNNTTNTNSFNPQPTTIPHARPRGDSIVSVDSAQRVSVAAFREMAARSRNNSPSPSLRPPSTTDLARLPPLDHAHSANSHLHGHGQTHGHLRPGGGIRPPVLSTRSSIANALFTSTDTESETESSDPAISDQDDSEAEEDEGAEETLRPKRNGTITQRSPGMGKGRVGGKASSEMGHRALRTPPSAPTSATRRVAKSALGHGDSPSPNPNQGGIHHASSASATGLEDPKGANVVGTRARASASTSALQPNAAARRASMLANSKGVPVLTFPRKSLALASSSSSSSSSSSGSEKDSDSEDDAPLASFMLPKRPGSAASSASRPRPPRPSKPLIDITTMGVSAPQSPVDRPPLPSSSHSRGETQTPIRSESQPQPRLPSPPPVPAKSISAPAQTRPTLGMEKPSLSDRLAKLTQGQGVSAGRSVESLSVGAEKERGSVDALRLENESERTKDKDMQNVRRNVNGRARPTRSQTAPLDAFPTPPTATSTPPPSKSSNTTTHSTTSSPPSPTFSRTTRRSFTVPNGAVFDLTDEGAPPIVPRRIRERSPPPAFSVTSRPISQMSAGSGSVTGVMGGGSNAKGTVQHTHNSSTSTIRMLGGSVIAGGAMGNGTRDTQGKFVSSSSGPLPSTSGSPTTSTSSSSSSSSYSSSLKNPATLPPPPPSQPPIPSMVKSTLAPPGNTQPILRAPPPRTSSRPRAASSSLIPYGGKKPPETEGFTGGGLVATIVPERANGKGKRGGAPSAGRVGGSLSVSGNLNGGVSSNVNGVNSNANAGGVKTRGRSSTTIPMLDVGLDVGPSLSKAISDYSSVSGSGSNSRGGAGGGNSRSSSAMASQPHPILVNSNTNPKTNNSNPRISSSSARPSSTATSALPYMIPSPSSGIPPPKPFAGGMRGNSPASSTGDSSSGRTPLTPADGSELGSAYSSSARGVAASSRGGGGGGGRSEVGKRNGASGGKREEGSVVSSATGGKGHRKSGSVGFQESERDRERDRDRGRGNVGGGGEEERRKERRRSEARAAIELGNVVNGRGPIANDDDDEDLPLNTMGPRMSIVNPMFNLTPPSPMSWRPPSAVLPPQSYMFPVPPSNSDPSFIAAHQQAMMVAKQAYQIAVAQQAMAQANEEWERGSTATSAAFGGSVTGYGGMGGVPMGMGMPGMQGMGGMSPAAGGIFPGYGMGMQAGWPNGMMFPTSAQSMYAASMVGGGGSEMGGNMSTVGNAGGWGTRSEYGGPSVNRSSGVYRNSGIGFGQMGMGMGMHGGMHGGSAQSHYGPLESGGGGGGRREGPRPRTKTAPSAKQGAVPPSSWKSNPQRRV